MTMTPLHWFYNEQATVLVKRWLTIKNRHGFARELQVRSKARGAERKLELIGLRREYSGVTRE